MPQIRVMPLTALLMLAFPLAAQEAANPHGERIGACATCHSPEGWRPIRLSGDFQHAPRVFPLDGAHTATSCTACHQSLEFAKAPTRCADCHQDVHSGELGIDCARCHTPRSFVDEAQLGRLHEDTRLPLRGAHAAISCLSCHLPTASGKPQYIGQPTTCIGCHQADFDRAISPQHAAGGLPTTCLNCHTELTWQGAGFDHGITQFPLDGAHLAVSCTTCHLDGVYRGTSDACVSCHRTAYDGTMNPAHASAGYSTVCTDCHTNTTTWLGAVFNHSTSQFPLTGAHLAVGCSGCHADGVYRGQPTACAACHQADYEGTRAPPHSVTGYSTDCTTCHTTSAWAGATFSHSTTAFPLTGAHLTTNCTACHDDGVYRGKVADCAACHQADYTRTADPNHQGAGFPVECAACHTTSRWAGATFDHDTRFFPVYSGKHRGTWSSCATCHTVPANFTVFTCTTCHVQSRMDDEHRGRNGYQYLSTACLSCHPSGRS